MFEHLVSFPFQTQRFFSLTPCFSVKETLYEISYTYILFGETRHLFGEWNTTGKIRPVRQSDWFMACVTIYARMRTGFSNSNLKDALRSVL